MLIALISIATSCLIVKVRAKNLKKDRDKIEDIFIIVLISGFIGARLGYVIVNFKL